MPGRNKIKSSGSDFGQNFSPKKKDFVGLGKPSKKKDFVGLGKPNTKKVKQKDDKSDFSGGNKFTPKVTKSIVSKKTDGNKSKPKVVTPKMIKDAGFTTLRDYLNDKSGLKRKDGKKVVRTSTAPTKTKRVRGPKVSVPGSMRGGPPQKTGTKTKSSMTGIDGPSSVKKKKAKTGFGSKAMTTKVPKKTRQGITRTPFQAKGKRKSMMGST